MLVIGATPSGPVIWLALSRAANAGGPPTRPPAWALPCSGSFSAPPSPKLKLWRLKVCSVKPRK
jgi:hypothetical protein